MANSWYVIFVSDNKYINDLLSPPLSFLLRVRLPAASQKMQRVLHGSFTCCGHASFRRPFFVVVVEVVEVVILVIVPVIALQRRLEGLAIFRRKRAEGVCPPKVCKLDAAIIAATNAIPIRGVRCDARLVGGRDSCQDLISAC